MKGYEEVPEQELPQKKSCLDSTYRWIVLFFIMWLTFGSYWVFDTPGALFKQLQTWFGGPNKYTSADNLNLYSVYSYPNTVLCFFGGFIIDRITGLRMGALLFCGFILAGELMFAIGIQVQQYYVCLVGRFIFGLGGESLTVAQNNFTARWFDGPQLAMAFGLVLSFARIGSSVNFAATPFLAEVSVPFAVWFGAGTCFISFFACIMLSLLDKAGEHRAVNKEEPKEKETFVQILLSLLQVFKFPISTWFIYFICVFFYVGVLTFYTVASDIMQKTGAKYSENIATLFISIPNFVSIIASPLFGFMIDKMGKALYWMLWACFMLVVAHMGFLGNANEWFEIHPIVIMLWLGVGYSMFAASIWPLLPFIIASKHLGTAYGAMTAIQNAGLAVLPQIIGALQGASGIKGTTWEYTIPIMIFVGCAGVAAGLTVFLILLDKGGNQGKLNASGEVRQQLKLIMQSESDALPISINEETETKTLLP
jgi:MFS family permease